MNSHVVNLGSGALGFVALNQVPSPLPTGVNIVDMGLKIIIAVVSVLPSILSLFKKKKKDDGNEIK